MIKTAYYLATRKPGTWTTTLKRRIRLRKNLFTSTLLASCSVALLLFSGCGQETDGESSVEIIEEGKIVYSLSYPQFESDNIFTSMFPKEMSFKFKDNNTRNELKTSMAVFSTSLLANSKEKKVTQYMLVTAHNVKEAYDRIYESLNNMLVSFNVPDVSESQIVEIFPYEKDDEELNPAIPDNLKPLSEDQNESENVGENQP